MRKSQKINLQRQQKMGKKFIMIFLTLGQSDMQVLYGILQYDHNIRITCL